MASMPPAALRAAIQRDLAPVRPLPSPVMRGLSLLPLAALLLAAAPLTFSVRVDLNRLGYVWGWGASLMQIGLGIALVVAALREAIPGRTWSPPRLTGWIALTALVLVTVTLTTFAASPVRLGGGWWTIGAMCLVGSAISALPAVALGSVLAARAWPTRPAIAGLLIGLGAGMMSDAGWRLFCHFSEPAHVLAAHAGAVVIAAGAGAWLTVRLARTL
jgi:hypothetical protein